MICRTCLRRASALRLQPSVSIQAIHRPFSLATPRRNAAPTAAVEAPQAEAASTETPPLTDPLAAAAQNPDAPAPLSSCPKGTVLNGLNFFKGKTDPVAMADEDYPAWLWRCLEVTKKAAAEETDVADEFSKSKKQRRLAMKKQRQTQEQLLATGNLEALAPKIPLQQQSINLPGEEGGSPEDAVLAADKRLELRKAMRKERKAKIKENNFLKSM